MRSGGVTTTGMVLTRDVVPARSSSSTRYRVSYRFTTLGGDVIEGSDGVDVSTWEHLQERGPIAVHYLPGRPSSNRLAPGAGLAAPLIFLLVGLTITGAGGVLVVRALRHILEARRLLRLGRATAASVIGVDATNITVNGRQQFKVRYSYRDRQDRTHEGDSGYLGRQEAARWNPGDRVSIRYDPNRPDESVWIGEPEAAPRPTTFVDAPPPTPPA